MSLPRLPGRLRTLRDLLPPAIGVADVGAGHGALAAHLAADGWSPVIAIEVAAGPLAELRCNLARWESPVDVRGGAGLEPLLPGEVEVAVVAGMGARSLLDICALAASRRVEWLVLQCVQDAELVDPWLCGRDWRTLRRQVVIDRGRTYPTWLVEVGR